MDAPDLLRLAKTRSIWARMSETFTATTDVAALLAEARQQDATRDNRPVRTVRENRA